MLVDCSQEESAKQLIAYPESQMAEEGIPVVAVDLVDSA